MTFAPRRAARATVALTVAALFAAGGGFWLGKPFRGSAETPSPAVGIHKVQGASWRPELGQPLFLAVLGSDARRSEPGAGGSRCDAIHIVAINPVLRAGTILDFPRDSWIPVAGRGQDKINAACVSGPETMVRTLVAHTGIPIQYYVMTEFSHFVRFIDELGGVDVNVPYAMRDPPSGAHFSAGPTHMNGSQALAFSRNRKDTPRGDFSRSENQGILILATLAKFRGEAADPHRVLDYVRVARRHTKITVPLGELVKMALLAREIDPAAIRNVVIPGSTGSAGGASVVFLAPGDTYARVRDDAVY